MDAFGWSALRALTAWSQASALREVMITVVQPARRRPVAAWRPRPLEPPVMTAVLPFREKRLEKFLISDIVEYG